MGAEFHLKQNLEQGEYRIKVEKVNGDGCASMIVAVIIVSILAGSAFAMI